MTTPQDPILFDFGVNFRPVGEWVADERSERHALAAREIPYHHGFLDDILRGILPHDLIVVGAESGVGKTALVTGIAKATARAGKRVFYFALEAEPREIERRIKYELIAELCKERKLPFTNDLNYPDWYRGRFDGAIGSMDAEVDAIITKQFSGLHTYYRGAKFDHEDIRRLFMAIQDQADLIILDHLHYVDIADDNENRGYKRTVKMIRDVALGMGRPVILVVHLRKKDDRSRSLVPEMDRIMGSSDIFKICTHSIMVAPCRQIESPHWAKALTWIHVPKDRMGGTQGYVALCAFDLRYRTYSKGYGLGKLEDHGERWQEIKPQDRPRWASNFQSIAVNGGPVTTRPEPKQKGGRK